MLKPREDKGKAICVSDDDDVSNFDDGGRYFVDDYFGLHILGNDQNEASQVVRICGANPIDHPSQIYRASRDNNKVTYSNPTLIQLLHVVNDICSANPIE